MARIGKRDIAEVVAKKCSLPKKKATEVVGAVLEAIEDALKKGDVVVIPGFGSFKVIETKAREVRNPRTGEKIKIPARKRVRFSAGKNLKTLK